MKTFHGVSALFLLSVFVVGFSNGSEIATNENGTEYGIQGVILNPKLSRFQLKCNYTGDGYKTGEKVFRWLKNDQSLEDNSKYIIENDGFASTLTVEGTEVIDAGNYTCKFNNQEEATLRVFMYPTLDHTEKSKNQVQGDSLTLLCKARGYPTPTVKWFKDDLQLETDGRMKLLESDGIEDAKLVIEDLQYEDKGKYVCKATSLTVTRSLEISVRVKDKYAALWPFLGICAEVAILCTIIFIYEKRRTKPEFEEEDDQKKDGRQRK